MHRPAAIVALLLASTAVAADTAAARFRASSWPTLRVEVVLERVVEQRGAVLQAHKTLGAYDLVTTPERGGVRVEAKNVVIVDDAVHPADPLAALALGALAPYHVDKKGLFIGLASADAPVGVDAAMVLSGARRQWADLVTTWQGRTFSAGTSDRQVPNAEQSTETIEVLPCGEATCVRVDRTTSFAPTAAQLEGVTVGAEGTLLGWTDHLRATFERDGLVPHELASERTLHLAIPGQTEIVDRIDRSTRRFTPGGSR